MKSIALFDIDETIFSQQSLFPVIKKLIDLDLLPSSILIDIDAEYNKYKNQSQSYSETGNNILNLFCLSLSGKEYSLIYKVVNDFFIENRVNFYSYFSKILPRLKTTHIVYLVTANSQMFGEVVKEMFDLDGYLCTNFEVIDGKFTGKILNSLADGKHIVEELLSNYEGKTMAFGDSENDIGMLEKVSIPVCVNPTSDLLIHAKEKNWTVVSDEDAYKKILNLLES
jgi:phosphoserine phosphatase